jgi:hypothetical protein
VRVADLIAIGRRLNGKKVKKQFGEAWFSGTVTSFSGLQRGEGGVDLWQIIYEDHDQEQVDSAELWNILLERPNFPAAGQPQQFCEPGDGLASPVPTRRRAAQAPPP